MLGYTGNKPTVKPENCGSRAVDLVGFRTHCSEEIAEHNAQSNRNASNCAGRSFDQTFQTSMEISIVRWPTAAQKSFWLLASEATRHRAATTKISVETVRPYLDPR
ncbi:transposase domain-containing protein [Rhizobium sp. BK251]|uniref:transposase domain-containing protein n=1 Tax=Rhizobium sp. BK251 TaxID=2512125 RepID=UPI0010D65E8D|nr:transposase domain-containing protein [Rhizobium sp. BK251]TCL69829.1 bacteriophage Mu transposase [Rhizobium sp. BK251]